MNSAAGSVAFAGAIAPRLFFFFVCPPTEMSQLLASFLLATTAGLALQIRLSYVRCDMVSVI